MVPCPVFPPPPMGWGGVWCPCGGVYTYIPTYLPTYLHTYVHTYIHTITLPYLTLPYLTLRYLTLHSIHTYIPLHYITLHYLTLHYLTLHSIHTYIPAYIPTYQHTNIPTYQHTTTTGHRGGDQKNHTTTTGHRGGGPEEPYHHHRPQGGDQKNQTILSTHTHWWGGGGGVANAAPYIHINNMFKYIITCLGCPCYFFLPRFLAMFFGQVQRIRWRLWRQAITINNWDCNVNHWDFSILLDFCTGYYLMGYT